MPGGVALCALGLQVTSSDVHVFTLEAAALPTWEGPTRQGSHPHPPGSHFPSPPIVRLFENVLTLMSICSVSLSSQQSGLSLLYTGSRASSPVPPPSGHFCVSSPGVPSLALCVSGVSTGEELDLQLGRQNLGGLQSPRSRVEEGHGAIVLHFSWGF